MAMSFVYIKVSEQKNLVTNEFLVMVIVFAEFSTQKLSIETVGSAVCICKLFSKKMYI